MFLWILSENKIVGQQNRKKSELCSCEQCYLENHQLNFVIQFFFRSKQKGQEIYFQVSDNIILSNFTCFLLVAFWLLGNAQIPSNFGEFYFSFVARDDMCNKIYAILWFSANRYRLTFLFSVYGCLCTCIIFQFQHIFNL